MCYGVGRGLWVVLCDCFMYLDVDESHHLVEVGVIVFVFAPFLINVDPQDECDCCRRLPIGCYNRFYPFYWAILLYDLKFVSPLRLSQLL